MDSVKKPKNFLTRHYPAPTVKSCGKNRYATRAEAETVAAEQETIFAREELHLHVYHCAMCGGWHLTKRERTD
jgi:hypothetical protein